MNIETTKTTSYRAVVSKEVIIDLINERYESHIPHDANLAITWNDSTMTIHWEDKDD